MEKKTLESLVSARTYDTIVEKVKEQVGDDAFEYIFPGIKKALEEGSGKVREEILIQWLDLDCCRVCSNCGAIMEEGWYLDWQGYACSDECCCKILDVSKEEFDRYSIFLPEIEQHLEDNKDSRKPEDLSKEEINKIIDEIMENLDAYYYTEWY